VVYVAKGDAMTFLQMAEPAAGRDLLKRFPLVIAKHAIRDERAQIGIPCSEVKIKIAIVVQIAKIRAHRQQHFVQPRRFGHIAKSAVAVIMKKTRSLRTMRKAQIIGRDIADEEDTETSHEQVGP